MIKDVIIKDKRKEEKMEEGYYICIEYDYTTETVGPFYPNQKNYFIQFLNMLEDCLNAYPNGRGGYDDYEEVVEELKIWNMIYEDDDIPKIDKDLKKVVRQISFEWPLDPSCNGTESDIIDFTVQYYDKNDGWRNVELKRDYY